MTVHIQRHRMRHYTKACHLGFCKDPETFLQDPKTFHLHRPTCFIPFHHESTPCGLLHDFIVNDLPLFQLLHCQLSQVCLEFRKVVQTLLTSNELVARPRRGVVLCHSLAQCYHVQLAQQNHQTNNFKQSVNC